MPFKNFDIFWILVPIWLNMIFQDFFQEKIGTDFGNAITNGVTVFWVSIDWIRYLIRNWTQFSWVVLFKILLCAILLLYGVLIVVEGMKRKKYIKFVGRIRVVSYFMMVFSVWIYGITDFTLKYILAIIIFFPVFYFFFEIIDRLIPTPKTYEEKEAEKSPFPEDKGMTPEMPIMPEERLTPTTLQPEKNIQSKEEYEYPPYGL